MQQSGKWIPSVLASLAIAPGERDMDCELIPNGLGRCLKVPSRECLFAPPPAHNLRHLCPFAPANAGVIFVLLVGALSASGAILLILEL
jgi:hypothetical protein